MKTIKALCLMTILIIHTSWANETFKKDQLVSKLLDITQTEQAIIGFPEILEQFMEGLGQSNERSEDVLEIMIESFDEEETLDKVKAKLGTLSIIDLKNALDFYQSPLLKKFIEAEKRFSELDDSKALEKVAIAIQQNKIPADRVLLMRQLDLTLSASKRAANISKLAAYEMLKHALGSMLTQEQIKKISVPLMENVGKQVEQFTIVMFVYMYQGMSHQDLNQYIQMYNNNIGAQNYYDSFDMAFNAELMEWSKRIGIKLKEEFEKSSTTAKRHAH